MNIKALIISTAAFVLILVIIVIIVAVKKENANYHNNKKSGIGVITGKATNSSSSNVKFTVRVLNSGDTNSYNLKGLYNVKNADGSLNTAYPHFKIGDEVYVLYSQKKVAGINMLDVRINQDCYDYPN